METAPMFKLLREMVFAQRIDGPHAQILGNLCASLVMACRSPAIASALDNSIKGTSSGTRVLTRSPRYSTDKADVNGGFDWRAQFGGCT